VLKELWGDGVAVDAVELVERQKRVGSKIADWFAEFEKNNEVLVRMVMNVDEFASLRLAMRDEFKNVTIDEMVESGRRGGPLKMGTLWTAEMFVANLEWVELLGDQGKKIQKI
jgi:hypothetical protein